MKLNRKSLIMILLAVSVLMLILVVSSSSDKKERHLAPIHLNDSLTNVMSDLPELAGLDRKMNAYLRKWQIKGASLSIMRNDSLVYAKGYGWADQEKGIRMEPYHTLRMASVSKLITAVGIMVLQDKGMLNIKDNVFGPSGILKDSTYTSVIKDRNYNLITVEHLLRHQGGFYRDPLFSSHDVQLQMRLEEPPEAEDFFRLVFSRPLRFKPGTWQRYSNFGYLLLSEIIEEVSGKSYEEFIIEQVLKPAGCFDMHLATNYYEEKRPDEVRYYTHEGDGKYISEYNGSGKMVERCYGGNNIPLLSGAGAWCSSTAEIARLVASIDGKDEVPDIISKEAVMQMTEYFDPETFSLGWNDTTPGRGWSRTGTLAGTSALVKYFPDGECWILVTNSSTWKGPAQTRYASDLFNSCRSLYSRSLPLRDLFSL